MVKVKPVVVELSDGECEETSGVKCLQSMTFDATKTKDEVMYRFVNFAAKYVDARLCDFMLD